jgi:hypothetical protein
MDKYRVRFENAAIISVNHFHAAIEKFTELEGASPSFKMVESAVRDSRAVALGDLKDQLAKIDMGQNEVYYNDVQYTSVDALLKAVG